MRLRIRFHFTTAIRIRFHFTTAHMWFHQDPVVLRLTVVCVQWRCDDQDDDDATRFVAVRFYSSYEETSLPGDLIRIIILLLRNFVSVTQECRPGLGNGPVGFGPSARRDVIWRHPSVSARRRRQTTPPGGGIIPARPAHNRLCAHWHSLNIKRGRGRWEFL